jgi:hypothetical protein
MRYEAVVAAHQAIEATTIRRRMRDTLIDLRRATPPDLLPKLAF